MDERLLSARLCDAVRDASGGRVKFIGFLSEAECAFADSFLKNKAVRYSFFGGVTGAARTVLCVCPDWCEEPDFPITAFTFTYRKTARLSHRDFLGALMATGITRQSIGDILTENGRAVIFVSSDISRYVKTQISKVGNEGVVIEEGFKEPLPELSTRKDFTVTVAALRADCVTAALCNLSRNAAAEIISEGLVSINSKAVIKPTQKVNSGDRISVRGKGRFEINSADELSRKQRIILKYSKYI